MLWFPGRGAALIFGKHKVPIPPIHGDRNGDHLPIYSVFAGLRSSRRVRPQTHGQTQKPLARDCLAKTKSRSASLVLTQSLVISASALPNLRTSSTVL
jgi:hypothetical protein